MRGGVRLTLLRATDPGRVKEGLGSLPGVHAGLPIVSLEVWADQRQIVHRLAVTFRGTEIVNTGRPVSKAATQRVKQAQRALKKLLGQYRQSGKRPPASRLNAALNRVLQDRAAAAHHPPAHDPRLRARLNRRPRAVIGAGQRP